MEIKLVVLHGNIGPHFLKVTGQEFSTKIKLQIKKMRLIKNSASSLLEKKGDFLDLPGRTVQRGFTDRSNLNPPMNLTDMRKIYRTMYHPANVLSISDFSLYQNLLSVIAGFLPSFQPYSLMCSWVIREGGKGEREIDRQMDRQIDR